jgi:hypothetical protein
MKRRSINIIIYLLLGLPLSALVLLRFSSVLTHLRPFIETLRPIFFLSNASYFEKMSIKYPVYYEYIEKVKTLTPENSVIYIPRNEIPYNKPMWPIASLQISSAFLFPRKVSFLDVENINKLEKNSYIVIIDNQPEINIKAKDVFVFEKDTNISLIQL